MKSSISKTTKAVLELEEDEALWLRGLVQNPIYDYAKPEDEPKKDRDMRARFFNAVKAVGPQ